MKKISKNKPCCASEVAAWKRRRPSPVARLRLSPPLPALSWSSVLDASEFRAPCVQPDGSGSEDCLHLQVTAPASALSAIEKAEPVTAAALMDGSSMLEDMSAASSHCSLSPSTTHRLNNIGWPALPSLQRADGSVATRGFHFCFVARHTTHFKRHTTHDCRLLLLTLVLSSAASPAACCFASLFCLL
jgi:carboxylesterase type B